ncbi:MULTISPECIES: hypothetical protein [unclassified Streptomyces]|uniref:hypothetical protein n=1 Tax=unclassified Streptomyces TaxID=2593676 RepID=UPI001BE6E328|nr:MULTISPECIES: hypothetical protein [unclassified Streptomyces]MBT2402573.1 hypothetical protein [Streptomyces sp. ISL-21]MBT2607966.1 hypothetical protein [Streptomyces sp. ISL-87]
MSSLQEHWLRGVASNAAAPSDVLIRLLDPAARTVWKTLCQERDLPPDVIDAVIAHPERAVRRAFARNPTSTRRSAAGWSTTPPPSCGPTSPVGPIRDRAWSGPCPTTSSKPC